MIDKEQFLSTVIQPVLGRLNMNGEAAQVLLLGTALAESNLFALKQYGGGPALGVYQMEPATHLDIWRNYLEYRIDISQSVANFMLPGLTGIEQLPGNLYYATAMARIHYRRVPQGLPLANDPEGMSSYHKDHYNTSAGDADPIGNKKHFETAISIVL